MVLMDPYMQQLQRWALYAETLYFVLSACVPVCALGIIDLLLTICEWLYMLNCNCSEKGFIVGKKIEYIYI